MKKDKIVKAAEGAKKAGFNFLYSLVMKAGEKHVYRVVHVDDIILQGRWLPATPHLVKNANGNEHLVVSATDVLPPHSISRSEALRKFR